MNNDNSYYNNHYITLISPRNIDYIIKMSLDDYFFHSRKFTYVLMVMVVWMQIFCGIYMSFQYGNESGWCKDKEASCNALEGVLVSIYLFNGISLLVGIVLYIRYWRKVRQYDNLLLMDDNPI